MSNMSNLHNNYLQAQMQKNMQANNNCNKSARFLNNIELYNTQQQQKFTLNNYANLPLLF